MPRRSVAIFRRRRRIYSAQASRAKIVIADPPIMLPTIVPILEGVGLELSAWDGSEELPLMIPIDGEIVGVFVAAMLELAEVLIELMGLTELVAVSGKTGSDDERDILALVNAIGGTLILLGTSECQE